jgi:uncharacterized repeat protein (TIGR01451 family)
MLEALEERTLPSVVQLSLSGPATVVRGTDIHYQVTITNTDSSDAWNVNVTGTLPSGTTFRFQDQTSGPEIALTNSGNVVNDVLDILPAGTSATIDLVAQANADLGNNTVLSNTVAVSDDNPDDSASASANTTVAPGIEIAAVADQQNREGDTPALQLSAAEPNGTAVPLSVNGLPDGLTFSSDTNTITGTIAPGAADKGPFETVVTASGGSTSSNLSFVWYVAPRLQFTPLDDQQNLEGDTVDVSANATSPDGTTISFSADGLPDGLRINAGTGRITGTVAAGTADSDSYDVTLTATDGTYSATQTLAWDVAPRITFTDLADRQTIEGATVSLRTSASTPDGIALQYGADGLPNGVNIDPDTGLLSGTLAPGTAVNGPYDVTVTATDGTYSGAQTFTWDVTPRVTFAAVDDQQAMEGETVSFQVSAGTPDNAALTSNATGLPNGLIFDATTATVSGAPAPGTASDLPYEIAVTASDGVYQSTETFEFTVTPRVTLQTLANEQAIEGEDVSVQAQAIDAVGESVQYAIAGQPDGVSINPDTGLISGTLAADAAIDGPYAITVTASAGAYSASQTFTLDVGPQVTLTPVTDQQNVEGDQVGVQPVATTDVSTPLSFAAEDLPSRLTIDPDTGAITGQLAPGSAGNYQTTITVYAGDSWDSQTFAWTVAPRITFSAVTDQANNEGDTVDLQTNASAVDGAVLSYFADNLPNGLSIDPDTGRITGTVAVDSAYTTPYRPAVYATDGVYTGHVDFPWQINSAVSFTQTLGNQHSTVGDKISLQVQATSDHGPVVFTAAGLPPGLTIDSYNGKIAGTIATAAAFPIPLAVTVTASDGQAANRLVFAWQVDAAAPGATPIVAHTLTNPLAGGKPWHYSFPADGDNALTLDAPFFFSDNQPQQDVSNYTIKLNWGDGNTEQLGTDGITVDGSTVTVPLHHVFPRADTYDLTIRVSTPDGSQLAVEALASAVASPNNGWWSTLVGLAKSVATFQVSVGGKTYVVPTNLDQVQDNLRNFRDSVETVARDALTTVVVAGQTIQAKFVETLQAGANTVEWLVDQTGKQLAVIGNVIVEASKAATEAFVDQLKAWGGSVVDLFNRINNLRNLQINVDPQAIIQQVISNPQGVVQNLLAGVKLGLEQYFDPTQIVSRVQGIVFNWLFNNDDVRNQVSGLSQILANADFNSLAGLKKLVLDVAWQLSNAGAINLDFLKQTIAQVTGYDPDTVMAQVTQFQQLVQNGTVNLDALKSQLPDFTQNIFDALKQQAIDYVKNSVVPRLIAEAVAALDPTGVTQALKDIYNAVDWFTRNAPKLVNVLNTTLGAIQTAANSTPQQVAGKVYQAIDQAIPPLLDIGATKLGLGGVPLWLTQTLQKLDLRTWVRLGIQKLWQAVKNTVKDLVGANGDYVWLSGYKVIADETAILQRNGLTLSDADAKTIKRRIENERENEGGFGAVGQYAVLEQVLTSVLSPPAGGTAPYANVDAAFDAYFVQSKVVAAREYQERRINDIGDINDAANEYIMPSGRHLHTWTEYVYIKLNNQDARGKTLEQYETDMVNAQADLSVKNQSTHGHHIVFKKALGGPGQAAAKDAKDILLYYGINPYTDRANLEYAPNQGHKDIVIQTIDNELKLAFAADPDPTSPGPIIKLLKELGWKYINGKIKGVDKKFPGTVPQ